ncbi:MAG TPA: CARDB domain-containing protein [Thermoanaerobaculia bacterium]|jgi:hypothetical protein|nr:CARDB domain-containing protein [Thermoanaerobaculia bacterium]
MLAALLLLADLEVTSVAPAKDVLITDELFRVAVRVRNRGPAAAKDVKVKIGVNTLTFMNELAAPKGWTCEKGPQFGYALSCTTPSLAAGAEAEMNVTFATPQHSALSCRIGAVVESPNDSEPANNLKEKVVAVVSSETNAELSLTARAEANQVKVEVRNAGPHDAREVMVVLNEAFAASGNGWKCKGKLCTLPLLRAGTSATLTVRAGAKATVSARVRADRVREAVIKDNGAKVTLP